MKPIDRLISVLSSLMLILVGGTGVLTGFGFFESSERPILKAVKSWFFQSSGGYDGPLMFIGYVILLGLGIGLASIALRRDEVLDSVTMETDEGSVEISLDALEDVIRSLRDEIDGVTGVTPEIRPTANTVDVRVNLSVAGNRDVPDVVSQYKKRLNEQLSQTFKIKNLDSISVRIKNVSDFESGDNSPDDQVT